MGCGASPAARLNPVPLIAWLPPSRTASARNGSTRLLCPARTRFYEQGREVWLPAPEVWLPVTGCLTSGVEICGQILARGGQGAEAPSDGKLPGRGDATLEAIGRRLWAPGQS